MFIVPLLAMLSQPAHAASDIEFKTAGPVLIYVDGQQASLTSKLKQRLGDLEPGAHEIKVTGVFGKTLYEAEIELPDDTITQAEWAGGELKVLSTDWRTAQADEGEEEEEEEEVLVAEAPAEEPMAEPMEEVVEDLPLALPQPAAPAVAEAPVPAPATALPTPKAPGKTLTVQAQDGMRVEVVHNGQTVVVIVDGGGFRIEDPTGLEMSLTASR